MKNLIIAILVPIYFAIVVIRLAPQSALQTWVTERTDMFWQFWRLDQNWALFSPVIKQMNYHTTATVTFEDGTMVVWELPRMSRLSLIARFQKEKYRKWDIDSLPWEKDYKEFWPDFARYVGRKFYDPDNKPVRVSLDLHWVDIPPPEKEARIEQLPEHFKYSHQFTYFFDPEDFNDLP